MRRVHASITLAVAALALAGCTAQTQTSAGDFQGAERDVAAVVDDISGAARSGDADKLCNDIFTKELADRFKAGASTCIDQVQDAMRDSNDFDIEVQDVTVTGDTATARVRQPDENRSGTFTFQRVGSGWRASGIS
jgi:hypothetical protein